MLDVTGNVLTGIVVSPDGNVEGGISVPYDDVYASFLTDKYGVFPPYHGSGGKEDIRKKKGDVLRT